MNTDMPNLLEQLDSEFGPVWLSMVTVNSKEALEATRKPLAHVLETALHVDGGPYQLRAPQQSRNSWMPRVVAPGAPGNLKEFNISVPWEKWGVRIALLLNGYSNSVANQFCRFI